LVPATLTYNNLVVSGVEPWQAMIVAGVVEGLGFVAVTTVIDFYEHSRVEQARVRVDAWNAPRPVVDGSLWIALGGALLYWVAVFVINTFLDAQASPAKMVTGGILSTFGILGGVMVALRNQLSKRRQAVELADSRKRQADADARAQAERERERVRVLQAEKDRQELEFQRALQADQLRMAHALEMARLEAESARKLEKVRAVRVHSAVVALDVPAADAQSAPVRAMVQCSEPGCGMEYAAVGGKGGHYKKWHLQGASASGGAE
jgi:hypothetical protein